MRHKKFAPFIPHPLYFILHPSYFILYPSTLLLGETLVGQVLSMIKESPCMPDRGVSKENSLKTAI